MIQLQQAIQILLQTRVSATSEVIPITACLYRVNTTDIISKVNMPPFNKSAMDGYACKQADINSPLTCIGEIAAGSITNYTIQTGQCVSIMTGAPIPAGADMVVMKEDVEVKSNIIHIIKPQKKINICLLGEDVKIGEIVVPKKTLLKPAHIAAIAGSGYNSIDVYTSLNVAIASTGSEIIEPGNTPNAAQIYNSNSYQLLAQLQEMGLTPTYKGIVKDNEEHITSVINDSMQNHDVLILTGGVSVGDYDLVPAILKKINFEILFDAVAIKPGKPVCIAKRGNQYICALSGNPVSSFIQFEFIAKVLLLQLSGTKSNAIIRPMIAEKDLDFKPVKRTQFLPIILSHNGTVQAIEFHGSAHIQAFASADGLAIIEPETKQIKAGETVHVRFI